MRAGLPEVIAGFAGVASGMGQPERAARLLGASEALNIAHGSIFEPADQAEYDRILEHVRAQLDESTFSAAFAIGKAMTLEQAIAHALGEDN
jgi:hypothetical protein